MITFKQFLIDSKGQHGEYVADQAEKLMVNTVVKLLFGGNKDSRTYDEAYSFIESESAKALYDKYYDAFKQRAEYGKERAAGKKTNLPKESVRLLAQFGNELPRVYREWKKSQSK